MPLPFPIKLSTGLLAASLCLGIANHPVAAEDAAKPDEKTEPKILSVTGVFEGLSSAEITADTEHTSSLEISRIVPHATHLKKDQNVVWFDTEDMDEKIKEAEIDLRLSKLKLDEEEFGYQQFIETQRLDRDAADQARDNARQDYDNFQRVDRDRQVLSAEFDLKASEASLDNATEELEQLQQMYDEDDLTEESEEIVLKRAKQSVEFAQFRLDNTKIQSERSVKQTIPRREIQQESELARAKLTYQKAIEDLDRARQRRDIEIKRSRDKFAKEETKLSEQRAERKTSVLKSPIEGILLHGKLTRGKLGDKPSTLDVKSTVTGSETIATVVNPNQLHVRVDLAEKDLAVVTVGTQCEVVPTAFPDHSLRGTVKSVSSVPYAVTKFDCVVSFQRTKPMPAIMPTMTCDLKFTMESDVDDDDDDDDDES